MVALLVNVVSEQFSASAEGVLLGVVAEIKLQERTMNW